MRPSRLLLLVADEFPTHRPDVAVLFGKVLPRHAIESDLVAQPSKSRAPADLAWAAGRLFLCKRTGHRLRDQVSAFLHDIRALRDSTSAEYDAIQVRDKVFAGLIGIVRARSLRIPFFYWMSFPMSESFLELSSRGPGHLGLARWAFLLLKGYFGKHLLYRVLLPRCDHIFVQSEHMANSVAHHGIPRTRITPVPMGVDMEQLADIEHPPESFVQFLAGPRIIAYQGILDRSRRIDVLFEVLLEVRKQIHDCRLMLVGDTHEEADRTWLEGRAREVGVADLVIWTGWLPTALAWGYMRHADVAVSLIPRGDLFDCSSPTKLIEYLALGLPVVANDSPDQERVLSQSGAGLCTSGDMHHVSAAIVRVLQDEQLRKTMSKAGPPFVTANRSYDRLGYEVAKVYRRILAR